MPVCERKRFSSTGNHLLDASANASTTEGAKTLRSVPAPTNAPYNVAMPHAYTKHDAQYGGLRGTFPYATRPFLYAW